MRQVVLDTETTGLDVAEGHRIIEIGCVELIDRRATSVNFHHYLRPGREIDPGAVEVHGITTEFLHDKPEFPVIVGPFVDFIKGAELIIHNAPFDVGFINNELKLLGGGWGRLEDYCTVVDTLSLARQLHPGQKNTLDALCKRYSIDNSQRELHGALLDAQILADVYLAMTGGQAALRLDADPDVADSAQQSFGRMDIAPRRLPVVSASTEEREAHDAYLEFLDRQSGGRCTWKSGMSA